MRLISIISMDVTFDFCSKDYRKFLLHLLKKKTQRNFRNFSVDYIYIYIYIQIFNLFI